MEIIAIEEHYRPRCLTEFLMARKEPPRIEIIRETTGTKVYEWIAPDIYTEAYHPVYNRLTSIPARLQDMDEMGIAMQVLSVPISELEHVGVAEADALVKEINEELSQIINQYPDRFASFACVNMSNPEGAAEELERAHKQLGLRGTMLTPYVNGEYIDAKQFWPVFKKAVELDVPLYLHPCLPGSDHEKQYAGYPELAGAMWGFAAVTGLAAMRLVCSGIFDEYPNLKIILGHMGEAIPYWLSRMDNRLSILTEADQTPRRPDGTRMYTPLTAILKKLPSQYFLENFYITTSGVMWPPALLCSHLALGAEKILFAVDYPMESLKDSIQSIENAPLSYRDKQKIFSLNARSLFKLLNKV